MEDFRYCKYKDGTIKPFDDVKKNDIFLICEPDGTVLSNKDNSTNWFQASTDYDKENLGFKGSWIKEGL